MFGQDVGLVSLFIQIHRHVEMQIDQAARMQAFDAFFDGLVAGGGRAHGDGGGGAMLGRSGSSFARGANRHSSASNQSAPNGNTPGSQIYQRETSTIATIEYAADTA